MNKNQITYKQIEMIIETVITADNKNDVSTITLKLLVPFLKIYD